MTIESSGGTAVAAGLPGEFIVSVLPKKMPMASTMTHKAAMAAMFHRVLVLIFPAKFHIPDPIRPLTIMRRGILYYLVPAHVARAHWPYKLTIKG